MALERWTAVEEQLIRDLYPQGGHLACMAVMPNRGEEAIKQRACRMKVAHTASPFSKPGREESPVPLPAPHDYAPEDHAWMATRLPVFGGGFGAARISA